MLPKISLWDILVQTLQFLWQIFVSLPFVIQLLLIVSVLLPIATNLWEWRKLARSGIREIDRMDGKTFEKYLEILFWKQGYKVERTVYIGDYGADLVVSKDGVKTVVQAKRFKGNVGIKAVQEAVAAKGYYGCAKAMVVTNSSYTKPAVALAEANDVELWNRDRLVNVLLSVQKEAKTTSKPDSVPIAPVQQESAVPSVPPSVAPVSTPGLSDSTCAICGTSVSEKVKRYCLLNQRRFGGKMYCYEHQNLFYRDVSL